MKSKLEDGLKRAISFLRDAPIFSGICCCGDSMEGHPLTDHSPCDEGTYAAGMLANELEELLSSDTSG